MLGAIANAMIQQSGKRCTENPADIALMLAIIQEKSHMLECLAEANPKENRNYYQTIGILAHPAFDGYRGDPHFIKATNRLLPNYGVRGIDNLSAVNPQY